MHEIYFSADFGISEYKTRDGQIDAETPFTRLKSGYKTRSSAIAKGPHHALRQLKYCQLVQNYKNRT